MNETELERALGDAVGPRAVLAVSRFSRGGPLSAWIESGAIERAAKGLVEHPGLRLDWVENLSAMETEGSVVLTYFLSSNRVSPENSSPIVLRITLGSGPGAAAPSLASVWPSAEPFEREITERFGVRFR